MHYFQLIQLYRYVYLYDDNATKHRFGSTTVPVGPLGLGLIPEAQSQIDD